MLKCIKIDAYLVAFLLVGFPFFIFPQINNPNVKVEFGPEIKTSRHDIVDEIIGKDENGVYAMAKEGTNLTVFCFNHTLSLNKKNTTVLEYLDNDLQYKGLIQFGAQFILFTTYLDKKKKRTFLYRQFLNKATLTFSTPKEIGSASYDGFKRRESANYLFTTSADSNYLIFMTELPVASKEKEKFGLIVFDTLMNEVWRNENIELDKGTKELVSYQVIVGNEAQVYFLTQLLDQAKYGRNKAENFTFDLRIYGANRKPITLEIVLDKEFIMDISFIKLNNGNFQIVGLYSGDGDGQDGVFNIVYNKEFEIINRSKTEFSTDFIMQFESEKTQKKARKYEGKGNELELYSYRIDEVIENYDSSITIIGEQYFEYVTTYADFQGNEHSTTHFVHGNIVVVKFNYLGQVEWMELIPKKQIATNGGHYSGYGWMQLKNGNVVIAFNDNPKNSYSYKQGVVFPWSTNRNNTDFVFYNITDDGYVSRSLIYKCIDEQLLLLPTLFYAIERKEMVIIGETKRDIKLVKLKFNDN